MPLTPEDVRNKRFTPVRLREGYDMGEVDQFLDEVETELERLTGENGDLRSSLGAVSDGHQVAASQSVEAPPEPPAVVEPESQPEPEPEVEPVPVPVPVVTAPPTVGEASSAAARLLEIATRNADEVVTDAKNQAGVILAEAHTEAERLDRESRARADEVESDARDRADLLDSEIVTRRQQLFGDLERERDTLAGEVQHLQVFEREYRSRLKNYFAAQLAQLDGDQPDAGPLLPDSEDDNAPTRLRSLLGEEQSQQS